MNPERKEIEDNIIVDVLNFIEIYFEFNKRKALIFWRRYLKFYLPNLHDKLARGHKVRINKNYVSLVMDYKYKHKQKLFRKTYQNVLESRFFPGMFFYLIIEDKYGDLLSKDYIITPDRAYWPVYEKVLNSDLIFKMS